MSDHLFHCFSGAFTLHRRPHVPHLPLQAWDATDEYLLSTLAPVADDLGRVLIVNDQFGTLGVALHMWHPESWGDSFTAQLSFQENRERNQLPDTVTFYPAIQSPPHPYDTVVWRVPKSLGLFQQQLSLLQPLLTENTRVLVAGMVKHLPRQLKEGLEKLGNVSVGPVRKKALLFQVTPDPALPPITAPAEKRLSVPSYDLTLASGPNVFSTEKLDSGALFFVEQFAQLPQAGRIADLGCGNGILGLVAKRLQPEAECHFFDESFQAIAAAEANYRRNGFENMPPEAHFAVDDGLSHYTGEPFDLILCNPPFHQAHVVGDQIAWQMFVQSRRHLRPGGMLFIVGNRHLHYHVTLKRIFGNCRQIAANPQFVVLAATR